MMSLIDAVIVIIAVAIVVAGLSYQARKRRAASKNGVSACGCDGGCSGCGSSSNCAGEKK